MRQLSIGSSIELRVNIHEYPLCSVVRECRDSLKWRYNGANANGSTMHGISSLLSGVCRDTVLSYVSLDTECEVRLILFSIDLFLMDYSVSIICVKSYLTMSFLFLMSRPCTVSLISEIVINDSGHLFLTVARTISNKRLLKISSDFSHFNFLLRCRW